MLLFFVRPCWALKVPLQDRLITNIIEMNKVQFDLKSYAWFQNRTGTHREFHLKSLVWFQTKIVRHRVQLLLYYIFFFFFFFINFIGILLSYKSNKREVTRTKKKKKKHSFWKRKIQSLKYRIFQLVCTNVLLIQYWAGLWKVAKLVFHYPEIWLVTSKKPWNLIGCFGLVKLFRWLRKRCNEEQNKIHGKITQFWLVKINAVFK